MSWVQIFANHHLCAAHDNCQCVLNFTVKRKEFFDSCSWSSAVWHFLGSLGFITHTLVDWLHAFCTGQMQPCGFKVCSVVTWESDTSCHLGGHTCHQTIGITLHDLHIAVSCTRTSTPGCCRAFPPAAGDHPTYGYGCIPTTGTSNHET